jgi:Nif-specific regulatory protein
MHLMSEHLGLNRGRVVLKDAEGGTCRIQHAYGLTPTEIAQGVYRLDEGITGHVLTHGHLVLVQDIDKRSFQKDCSVRLRRPRLTACR